MIFLPHTIFSIISNSKIAFLIINVFARAHWNSSGLAASIYKNIKENHITLIHEFVYDRLQKYTAWDSDSFETWGTTWSILERMN